MLKQVRVIEPVQIHPIRTESDHERAVARISELMSAAPEAPKTSALAASAKPINEDELRAILDRLEATRDIFRENRELRGVLSRREAEAQALRSRNADLEDIMRKFAPMLLNAATTMGLAAKNEMPGTRSEA
jgi:hypothetical protein